MGRDPRGNHHRQAHEAKKHSEWPVIIGSQNNVVHVPLKPSQDHQRDVDDEETHPAKHH